jgi:hypothetical protein
MLRVPRALSLAHKQEGIPMADNSSSSVAIVAIVLLMLVAGFFFFTRVDGGGGPAKTVNVDLNVPKPEIPKPAN